MTVPRSACRRWLACCLAAGGVWHGMVQAQGIFTCVDAKGRRLTSDRPIPECIDREQRELSPSGALRRTVGPTLTAQEQATAEARQRLAQEEVNRQLDERRRDKALLARYPNKTAHDRERSEVLIQVDEMIRSSHGLLALLHGQRKGIEAEMEFYRANPAKAPAVLRHQFEDNEASVQAQHKRIKDQEAEKNRVNARFDAELVKLKGLWPDAPSAAR